MILNNEIIRRGKCVKYPQTHDASTYSVLYLYDILLLFYIYVCISQTDVKFLTIHDAFNLIARKP